MFVISRNNTKLKSLLVIAVLIITNNCCNVWCQDGVETLDESKIDVSKTQSPLAGNNDFYCLCRKQYEEPIGNYLRHTHALCDCPEFNHVEPAQLTMITGESHGSLANTIHLLWKTCVLASCILLFSGALLWLFRLRFVAFLIEFFIGSFVQLYQTATKCIPRIFMGDVDDSMDELESPNDAMGEEDDTG